MDIEGLKKTEETEDKNSDIKIIKLTPEDKNFFTHIKLSMDENHTGQIEFIEGNDSPGREPCEKISFVAAGNELLDRLIRAMAVIHFNLYEAENSYTYVDSKLIRRGFQIGTVDGGEHAWIIHNGQKSILVLSKTENGGLPSNENDTIWLGYFDDFGSSIKIKEITVKDAISLLDTNNLHKMVLRGANLEFGSMHLNVKTLH